jgi:hypothetical protein
VHDRWYADVYERAYRYGYRPSPRRRPAVLRERAKSLGQSLSGYLRDLMDADAAAETNAEVIARIARDREPVELTMDAILAARDEGRR